MGRGKYKFIDEYKFIEVPENDWFRMTREQRKKHLDKVSKVQLDSEDAGCSQVTDSSLIISAEQFHSMGVKVPLPSVQGIWKKPMKSFSSQMTSFQLQVFPLEAKW